MRLIRPAQPRHVTRNAVVVALLMLIVGCAALVLLALLPPALLVGPPGVRVLLARRWHGRYRVRGRGWEYDTHSADGWIPCVTNPSFEGDTVTAAVARWAEAALGEPSLPLAPAIAFPQRYSTIILEDPESEIVTTENAPWWAQRIGRVQRMDPSRVARFVEAVMDAAEAPSDERRPAASPRVA